MTEKGPTQDERDKLAELARKIVNPAALNMALTHTMTMGSNTYANSVAGNLFTRAVKTGEGAYYAGRASANAAETAYVGGKHVMGSSFSNSDVARMAYEGVIGSGKYTQMKVGDMAKLYGVKEVDPSIAELQIDQLDPKNETHAVAIQMYQGFVDNMTTQAVNQATGMDAAHTKKTIESTLKPKK